MYNIGNIVGGSLVMMDGVVSFNGRSMASRNFSAERTVTKEVPGVKSFRAVGGLSGSMDVSAAEEEPSKITYVVRAHAETQERANAIAEKFAGEPHVF